MAMRPTHCPVKEKLRAIGMAHERPTSSDTRSVPSCIDLRLGREMPTQALPLVPGNTEVEMIHGIFIGAEPEQNITHDMVHISKPPSRPVRELSELLEGGEVSVHEP